MSLAHGAQVDLRRCRQAVGGRAMAAGPDSLTSVARPQQAVPQPAAAPRDFPILRERRPG